MSDAKLNWGCGPVLADGWVNSDLLDWAAATGRAQAHVGDILEGLPFPDGYFGAIVANHSLQALDIAGAEAALRELHRVCASGGVLRVLVPDALGAFGAYRAGHADWPGMAAVASGDLDERFCRYLTWSGWNRSLWTPGYLADVVQAAGFDAHITGPGRSIGGDVMLELDTREGESIIVEGRRPGPTPWPRLAAPAS